jgi:type II secretory pathway pseudopilin PulG
LVVIIIIGILAAIALPSFLNQANKARQSEAKTYVGSMNRAQQTYYLENRSFTDDLAELALGIPAATENYEYDFDGDAATQVKNLAIPTGDDLYGYVGTVWLGNQGNAATTLSKVCEGELPGAAAMPDCEPDPP